MTYQLNASSFKFIGAVECAVADSIVYPARRYKHVDSSAGFVSELLCAVEFSICTSVREGLVAAVRTVAVVIVQSLPRNHSGFVKAMKFLILMELTCVVVDVSYSDPAHQLSLPIHLHRSVVCRFAVHLM